MGLLDLRLRKSTTPTIRCDLHSHLLPGVDDGVKSTEEALDLITELALLGYRKLIITPHIMSHRFPNTKADLLNKFAHLKQIVETQHLPIELELGAEYFFDAHFLELIERNELLTFSDRFILFELPYHAKPLHLDIGIAKLIDNGYRPVMAHPERYLYYHSNFKAYEQLKAQGVFLQLNLNSLVGYYSRPVQKIAVKLYKKGLIDFLGSDLHGQRHLEALKRVFEDNVYCKYFSKNAILNGML